MDLRWLIALLFVGNLVTNEATKLKEWLDGHRPDSDKGDSEMGRENKYDGHGMGAVTEAMSVAHKQIVSIHNDCFATQRKFVELGVGEAGVTINAQIHGEWSCLMVVPARWCHLRK